MSPRISEKFGPCFGENENQYVLQDNKMEKRNRTSLSLFHFAIQKRTEKLFSAATSVAGLCAKNTVMIYAVIVHCNLASVLPSFLIFIFLSFLSEL